MNLPDGKKSGRSVTSCSECQRRKQKCDRNWPCDHCQARNTAHLCQFRKVPSKPSPVGPGGNRAEDVGTVENQSSKKRRHPETAASDPGPSMQEGEPDVTRALNDLGYVNSDMFRVIDANATNQNTNTSPLQLPEEIHKALRTVPARPYTDDLMQNFFEHVNYHYNILHQTSFLATYTDWWARKRDLGSHGTSTIVFTCLVLRICANSIQFLPTSVLTKFESDLGESVSGLSTHYQTSAQTLSNYISPGDGGLMQVQQLFLGATWLKAEAEFVKAWHAVGAAVLAGQEIGIHKDDPSESLTDFEREMRKRVWCGLYTWDKFMSALFNRPSLIASTTAIPLPNPRLDQPSSHPNIPSSFVAKILEFELASHLSLLLSNATNKTDQTQRQEEILKYIEQWLSSLPVVFSIHNIDTSYDVEIPRLVFQRLQLHCSGYMTLLMFLQHHLTSPPTHTFPTLRNASQQQTLQAYAIDTSLSLMRASKSFFEISYPDKVKYFMVAFSPFNTGALLCSALLNDKERVLYRRTEMLQAVGTALFIAGKLKGRSRMGDATFAVLGKLVSCLFGGLLVGEREILEGVAGGGGEGFDSGGSGIRDENGSGSGSGNGQVGNLEALGDQGTWGGQDFGSIPGIESALNLNLDSSLNLNMDLGVLDGVWDWENTIFDPFRNP